MSLINDDIIRHLRSKFINATGRKPNDITLHKKSPLNQIATIDGMDVGLAGFMDKDEVIVSDGDLYIKYRLAILEVEDNFRRKGE